MTYALPHSAPDQVSAAKELSENVDHEALRRLLIAVASIWQLEEQVAESCVQKAIEIFHVEGIRRSRQCKIGLTVTGGLAPWQIRSVKNHIANHLDRAISTREMAHGCRLSLSHFRRAFQNSFGICPHAFLLQQRVLLAQRMMLGTREPLSGIAVACGFSDQSHLTRVFVRAVGETPCGWRKSRLLSN